MHEPLVTGLIAALFLAVAALLGYGAFVFRTSPSVNQPRAKVNMRLEVLWTAIAGGLLLAIFVYVR